MLLKFCSKRCQQQHTSPTNLPLLVKVFSPSQLPNDFIGYSRKIQDAHTEVLFIQGYRSDPGGNHVKVDIALCSGDGSDDFPESCTYIVYYHRGTFSQLFVEYYVSNDMTPLQMLPYYDKTSLHDIIGDTLPESIKEFVIKAFIAHSLPLDAALSNLSVEDKDGSADKEQNSSFPTNSKLFTEEDHIVNTFQFACTQMKTSDSEIVFDAILKDVSDKLMVVKDLFVKASPQLRGSVVDSIVNLVELVKTFHTFLEKLFQGME